MPVAWLAKRYSSREGLAAAWGLELRADEDPADQTVALPQKLQAEGIRSRDCSTNPSRVPSTTTLGRADFEAWGGILTGAMGALQGWGGIWRFAYSHNREWW